ncbi:TAFII28-like protein domain-containing protein [Entamoeba marina]
MSKQSLPSLNAISSTRPAEGPQPPPPQEYGSTNNSGESEEDDDDFNEDFDDDDDTIKTEEDEEEIPTPRVEEKVPKQNESRSFKILKLISEPLEDENGDSTYQKELQKFDDKRIELLKNPSLKKVHTDNIEIYFKNSEVGSVMESVDESLTTSKDTRVVMSSVCKVFLIELVDETFKVKKEIGTSGPLKPEEVAAAYRRLRQKGSFPQLKKQNLFEGVW